MIAIGAAVSALLTLAIFATEFLPADSARKNLQRSFDNGALVNQDWRLGDRVRGYNQYNDCLLVMMTRFRDGRASSSIAPVIIFSDQPPLVGITECAIARAAVASDTPRRLYPPNLYFPYGRYIHAYRIPFGLFIQVTTVDNIRIIYRVTVVLLICALLFIHGRRAVVGMRSSDLACATTAFGFVIVTVAFAVFSGLDLFAQSLTHGPSDILLLIALLWCSLSDSTSARRGDFRAAALGAVALAFDFLHGTLPMMLAIIIGSAGLRAFQAEGAPKPFVVARLCGAFVIGVGGAIAVKLAALLALQGVVGLNSFLGQLKYRVDGDGLTVLDAAFSLLGAAYQIGWGHGLLTAIAVLLSLICALAALIIVLRDKVAKRERLAVLTALSSMAVIFCWYGVFRSHTALHATFMVRLLAWPIGMGPACLALALSSLLWPEGGRMRYRQNGAASIPAFGHDANRPG